MVEYIIHEENYPLATGQSVVGELVRCRDCIFYDMNPNVSNGECVIRVDAFNVFYPDDFCSYAERRKND